MNSSTSAYYSAEASYRVHPSYFPRNHPWATKSGINCCTIVAKKEYSSRLIAQSKSIISDSPDDPREGGVTEGESGKTGGGFCGWCGDFERVSGGGDSEGSADSGEADDGYPSGGDRREAVWVRSWFDSDSDRVTVSTAVSAERSGNRTAGGDVPWGLQCGCEKQKKCEVGTLKWGEEGEGRSGFLVSSFSVHTSSFLLWGSDDRWNMHSLVNPSRSLTGQGFEGC